MSFRPSLHGWPFTNDFTPSASALGLSGPPFPELGLGGGMCWTALDRYRAGLRIPRELDRPAAGEPLYEEIVARQVASLGCVWQQVRQWQSLPSGSWRDRLHTAGAALPGGGDVTSLSRSGWRGIGRRIDRSEPVLLVLLPEADGYARSTAAWQVLAYGYTRDAGRITLSIYDPARPEDDDHRLSFSLRGELDARLTGGRRIRGFLPVAYDRTAPRSLRAETFADRAVIGLNRKVRGRLGCAPSRRRLDLVARDPDGALLHFHRTRNHWEGANVTERQEMGTHELYSDPVAVRAAGALHVFAKSYVGDLLHFSQRRSWSVANRTDTKRAGARFRLEGDPVPVALQRGAVSVVGRGRDGILIHYTGKPMGGWTAEEVSAAGNLPLHGDPLAVRIGKSVHVVGRSREGHVLHFERMRGGWSAADATQEAFPERTVRLAGGPAVLVIDSTLHVFGHDDENRLVELTRDEEGRWKGDAICEDAHSDPSPTTGPAGIHVFALGENGQLLHGWREQGWRCEDVTSTRAALDAAPISGPTAAWGDSEELRVFGRRNGELWLWTWRSDSDWSGAPAHQRAGMHDGHRTADAPALVLDGEGRPHLFTTDGDGTVVHLEPGDWLEPDPLRPALATRSRRTTRSDSSRAGTDMDPVEETQRSSAEGEDTAAADEAAEVVDQPVVDQPVAAELDDALEPVDAFDAADRIDVPFAQADAGEADVSDGAVAEDSLLDIPTTAGTAPEPEAWEPIDGLEQLNPAVSENGGHALEPIEFDAMDLGPAAAGPVAANGTAGGPEEAAAEEATTEEDAAEGLAEALGEEPSAEELSEDLSTEEPDEVPEALEEPAPAPVRKTSAPRAKRPAERPPRKVVPFPLPLLGEADEKEDAADREDPTAAETAADEANESPWDISDAVDVPDEAELEAEVEAELDAEEEEEEVFESLLDDLDDLDEPVRPAAKRSKNFRWEPDEPEPGEEAEEDEDPLDLSLMDSWPKSAPSSKRRNGSSSGGARKKRG